MVHDCLINLAENGRTSGCFNVEKSMEHGWC
uniref:Uncharacterized protein n=1 Tax=Rhizophora mucronata TaxID=61149 RepID=A0A2P2N265_RHIMU